MKRGPKIPIRPSKNSRVLAPFCKIHFSLKSLKQLWEVVVRHRLLSFFYQVNSLAFIQKNLSKISPGIHETVL